MVPPDGREVNHTGNRRHEHDSRYRFHRPILTSVQGFTEEPGALDSASKSRIVCFVSLYSFLSAQMSDINAPHKGGQKDDGVHLVVNHWINRRRTRTLGHAGTRSDGDYRYDSPGHCWLCPRRPGELGHLGCRHQRISAGWSPAFDTRRNSSPLDLANDEEPQYGLSRLQVSA